MRRGECLAAGLARALSGIGNAWDGAVPGQGRSGARKAVPGQVAEQTTVLLDERVGRDPGGERSVGVGKWADDVDGRRGRTDRRTPQSGAQAVERRHNIA